MQFLDVFIDQWDTHGAKGMNCVDNEFVHRGSHQCGSSHYQDGDNVEYFGYIRHDGPSIVKGQHEDKSQQDSNFVPGGMFDQLTAGLNRCAFNHSSHTANDLAANRHARHGDQCICNDLGLR